MKKLLIAAVIFCLMIGSVSVYAENYEREDTISYGETKVITIPQPEGEVDEGYVYFTQFFIFTPEVDGTYRFMVSYEEDESNPYDIFMDVATPDGYWEIENGCEFEGKAGVPCQLMFQYNSDDGRYPEFTFYLESDDVEEIPKTGDESLLMSMYILLLAAAVLVAAKKKMV